MPAKGKPVIQESDIVIERDGDTWVVIGTGAVLNGKTYCHLKSTTRGQNRRNGWHPVQAGVWLDSDLLVKAKTND
jgi:hypothetical protein